MLKLKDEIKVYLSVSKTDMRKEIDGLTALVVDNFVTQPISGNIFIFFNKKKDKVKLLFWDRNGFVLYYKRLEKRKFRIKTTNESGCIEITQKQLAWLLAGLDFIVMNEFPDLDYDDYY
jgi:transposase